MEEECRKKTVITGLDWRDKKVPSAVRKPALLRNEMRGGIIGTTWVNLFIPKMDGDFPEGTEGESPKKGGIDHRSTPKQKVD